MFTRSNDPSHLPMLSELPQTPKQASSAQRADEQSSQKTQFLNSTRQEQALRYLKQTYHLERRTFL